MPPWSTKKPFINDPLKHGTTLMTNHIPNYAGFIPTANIHFGPAAEHGKGRNPRTTFLKDNITENFSKSIPGYAGYKPTNPQNDNKGIRDSIFFDSQPKAEKRPEKPESESSHDESKKSSVDSDKDKSQKQPHQLYQPQQIKKKEAEPVAC